VAPRSLDGINSGLPRVALLFYWQVLGPLTVYDQQAFIFCDKLQFAMCCLLI
jgi:hypothetical protein